MLKVQELVYAYGQDKVLNQINFEIKSSEIVGLLGPNGAGKTTLLNLIAGISAPLSGHVLIDGFDTVIDPLQTRARVGYLPDRPPLYPQMTVSEYLLFTASLRGANRALARQELKKLLDQMGLEPVRHRLIAHLSKGYCQRLGLAQALVGNPEVILLDEPTTGLDPLQLLEFQNLLRRLKSDHLIVLSSHQLHDVASICDRVIVLYQGEQLDLDTLSEKELKQAQIQQPFKNRVQDLTGPLDGQDLALRFFAAVQLAAERRSK